jgi:sugar lactone lactonase YvrE
MKRLIVLLVFGICLAGGTVQADTFVKNIPLGPQHARPESIARGWGGMYYVSVQNTPDAVATDGEILQVDVAAGRVNPFVDKGSPLRNPRGLAFVGNFLVVTDTDRIWKISQNAQVTPVPVAFPVPPLLLNDAAAADKNARAAFVSEMGPGRAVMRDPSGVLWPTDSLQAEAIPTGSRVYRITLDGGLTEVFTPTRKLLVVNGITQAGKNRQLLALDFFHGSVVEVDTRKDTTAILATGPFRGADGIEQADDGTIFVTSFDNGRVWRMDADGENVVKLYDLATDAGTVARSTLADLALDEAAELLYVPDALHGNIVVLRTE